MRAVLFALLAISGCAGVSPAPAASLMFPQRGRMAVVDAARVLPPSDVAALNAKVAAWDNATGHQLAIVTLPSLQGDDIADYGYRLGRAWGLGRKGINDGALLIIAPTEHRVRIEVGRGLEGDLTDAETSMILQDAVVPKLKTGDIAGAANAGADAIMAAVPAGAGDTANAPKSDGSSAIGWIMMIAGGLGLGWLVAETWWKCRTARQRAAEAEAEKLARKSDTSTRPIDRPVLADGWRPRPRYSRPSAGRSTTVIAPVFVDPPHVDTSPSWGTSLSDSGSSSSSDSGSSSGGIDSGGGDFGGGGSDSSW